MKINALLRNRLARAFLTAAGLSAVTAAVAHRHSVLPGSDSRVDVRTQSAAPPTIQPHVLKIGWKMPATSYSRIKELLWPQRGESISAILHALHLFSDSESTPGEALPGIAEMRSVMLDDTICMKWYGGRHSLVRTRYGARFVDVSATKTGTEAQAHRDQALAVLGEIGVPLAARLSTVEGSVALADVLSDAVANYSPDQEIEWTAMAFGRYLPPANSWTNKFGLTHNFDSLATVLMQRPPYAASCGGTHLLYALALILRADDQYSLLSADVRTSVRSLLRRAVEAIEMTQEASGAFSLNWSQALSPSSDPGEEQISETLDKWRWIVQAPATISSQPLLITGHHLEWLLILPLEFEVNREMCRRAALYLLDQLNQASQSDVERAYCPLVHAAFVLRHFDE